MKSSIKNILSILTSLALAVCMIPGVSWADNEAETALSPANDAALPDLDAPHEEGTILVAFKSDATVAAAYEALDSLCTSDELFALDAEEIEEGWPVCIDIDPSLSVTEAIGLAMQNEFVLYAQPNYLYEETPIIHESLDDEENDEDAALTALAATNDPAMDSTAPSTAGNANVWQLARLNAINAWDTVQCNNTVTVAVMDSGCLTTHEDLKDRILTRYVYDFVDNSQSMKDLRGHGTEVCGAIAATANNSTGTAGTSYNAKLLPLRVGGSSADDNTIDTAKAVRAYRYLIDLADNHPELGIHVVNLSWGSVRSASSVDTALEMAINAAMSRNIVTISAGGNGDDYGNPQTGKNLPSDMDAVVAVTALSHTLKTSSGVYGISPTTWCNYNTFKDLIAPGSYVYTTSMSSNSSYSTTSGTSIASPLTAGVFALLWAANPNLTVEQAKQCVYSTVQTDFSVASGRTGQYGKGIPNAAAAVNAALNVGADTSKEKVASFGVDSSNAPLLTTYKYSTYQTIYKASEIGRSGIISTLSYYVAQSGSNPSSLVKIYLGHTTKNSFSSVDDYIPTTDMTLVYASSSCSTGSSAGWESFALGSAFNYNKSYNLVITVIRANNSSGSQVYSAYASTNTTSNCSLYRASSTDSSYAAVYNNTMNDLSKVKPALKIGFTTENGAIPVDKPEVQNLTCNGEKQYAITSTEGYTISGTNSGTHAGTYTCTATLKKGYVWSDYTLAPLTITWTMSPLTVDIPESRTLQVDGNLQTGVDSSRDYVLSGTCRASGPGEYTAYADLPSSRDYRWSDGSTTRKTIAWKITTDTGTIPLSTTTTSTGGTQSGESQLPLNAAYRHGTTQMLFTPEEVGGAGEIMAVSLYLGASNKESVTIDDLRIYLCKTSTQKLDDSSDQLDAQNAILVYSGPVTFPASSNQWVKLTLNTAFPYDGVSNLGVIVAHESTTTADVSLACSAKPGMTLFGVSNDDAGEGISYAVSETRPDMQFEVRQSYAVTNYAGSTNAMILYAAKPVNGSLACDNASAVYDETKHAWVMLTKSALDELSPDKIKASSSAAQVFYERGDVNVNGAKNIVDSQIAYDFACENLTLSSANALFFAASDVNHDNHVDAADALAIQSYVMHGLWR